MTDLDLHHSGHRVHRSFFDRETVRVAKDLLGKVLCFDSEEGFCSGVIIETEAYTQEDPACHAYLGKQTVRNAAMFSEPGVWYSYFIYGMYHCLNCVTEESGRGCAVLLRGVIPLQGLEIFEKNRPKSPAKQWANGPAKLMMAMGIPSAVNFQDMCDVSSRLWIEDRGLLPESIIETPRIGISKGTELMWRFACDFNNQAWYSESR